MKKLLVCTLALLCMGAKAQDMMVEHGGLGYLYTDFNNFQNPAHLGLEKGTAVEGEYSVAPGGTNDATASFATSNGKVGFEAFGNSTGADVTNFSSSTETAGGEFGFALGKSSAIGVSYQNIVSAGATNSGTVGASLDILGSKGMAGGFGMAVGATSTINDTIKNTQTATLAVGYGFKPNNSIEADVTFNDWSNWNDYNLSGALTLGSQVVYFSALYTFSALESTNTVAGRLGFNLGKHFDISGTIGYVINVSSTPTYGGTFRISF
jgi:hypothetical protein